MDGADIDYRPDGMREGSGVDDYNQFFRAGLSWLAYVRQCRYIAFALVGVGFVHLVTMERYGRGATIGVLAVALLFSAYLFIKVRCTSIFTDEAGVWMASGVFPWQKAVYGIRWSDIGTAATHTGFLSWATGSYPVMVTNRWTQATVIDLRDVSRGRRVAERINEQSMHLRGGY